MMVVRRANDRRHERHGQQETWLTFEPRGQRKRFAEGFGDLEILTEHWLPPKATVRQPHDDVELVTYVHEGALVYEDSTGQSIVLHVGDFQRLTAGRGFRHTETNASRADWTRVFQIGVHPSEVSLEIGFEQKRFSVAERRGLLCLIASPDGRCGSLRVHQDAWIYSTVLDAGQHSVHELFRGRSAWLQVVRGEVRCGGIVLVTGDGVGITAERAASFTASGRAELLLVDLRPVPQRARGSTA